MAFIDRTSITFAGDGLEKPNKLVFDQTVISDLEIVDKKAFSEKILSIITNQGVPSNLIIIFADNATFFKEFALSTKPEQIDAAEKDFLSLVPFDKVAHKLIKFANRYQFVGVNWEMCTTLSETLSSRGFHLTSAIPATIVPGFSQTAGLTNELSLYVIAKQDSLKSYSLIETSSEDKLKQVKNIQSGGKKNYLPLLVGVLVTLLAVLAMLIVSRG